MTHTPDTWVDAAEFAVFMFSITAIVVALIIKRRS